MNQEVIAFARLTKIDEAKRLVFGRAVQEVPDRVGEIFDYSSSKPMFEKWSASQNEASLGKSAGNIRAMHKDVAAGIIVPGGLTFHDDECAIDVCAKITDDQEWEKCLTGTYTGFSIGGSYAKKWQDADLKKTRYTGNPSEISLVDRPCVGTATFFEIQKADGSMMQKNFVLPTEADPSKTDPAQSAKDTPAADAEKMVKMVLTDGTDLAFTINEKELPAVGVEFERDGHTYQIAKVADGIAHVDEIFAVEGTPAELGAFAQALGKRGLKIADATALIDAQPIKADPKTIDAKARELYKAAGGTDDDESKLAQFRIEAEKLLKIATRDDTSPAEGKAKYGSVKFADEVNKKYPIDTKEHVKAALSYIAMEKNAAKYSADDLAKIRAKIHAAAKEFGIDAEKAEPATDMVKGLRECGQLSFVIDALCKLAESVEFESAQEGDDSPLPARLYNCIADLGDVLKAMVDEEVKEEVEGGAADSDAASPVLAMAAAVTDLLKRLDSIIGITPETVEAKAKELAKGADVTNELRKSADFELRKVGARNSKADAQRIQAVHDHSLALGAICQTSTPAKGADNPAPNHGGIIEGKAQPTEELIKLQTTNDQMQKTLTEMAERLAKIEAQPLPVKGIIKMVAVGKSEDITASSLSAAEQLAAEVQPVMKQDGTIDEVATAMKMVLRKGGTRISMQKG